jgi:hypothetical protein
LEMETPNLGAPNPNQHFFKQHTHLYHDPVPATWRH